MAKSTRSDLQKFMARSLELARSRDKKKGFAADSRVTIDYLVGLYHGQDGRCAHTGTPMGTGRGEGDPLLCTIDRIDNARGYELGNIMLACHDVNKMRGDMDLSQFRKLCKRIGMAA